MNDALPAPKWNWGAPDFTKKKKSEEEVLREKYPSKYRMTLSAYYRDNCMGLPFREAWAKVQAAQQGGLLTYEGDLNDKMKTKKLLEKIKRKARRSND